MGGKAARAFLSVALTPAMGQGITGSFALASVKNSITGSYAEAMLKTMQRPLRGHPSTSPA